MPSPHALTQNYLLASFPKADLQRIAPYLHLVPMLQGESLYESGRKLNYIYFPTTSIVSLLCVLENGASVEVAVVGNDGLIGISLFMGGETTSSRAAVQSAGFGYRLKAQLLKHEVKRAGPILDHLLRYTQALITQMAQTAVCNRHHTIEQQVCRSMLLRLDLLQSNSLIMTHESIGHVLGVRRESITETASNLQRAGIISYTRGHITILNRNELEATACECYKVVKLETDRLRACK